MLANRVHTRWCGYMEFVPESTELSGIFLEEFAIKKADITVGASSPRDDGWMIDGWVYLHTPFVSEQKLRFTKSVGLMTFFAFLARNCVRCIALTKRFPVS
jgi:hypothetical protein